MSIPHNAKIVFWGRMAAIAAVVPIMILGFSDGPDPRHTGAPGDQTCAKATCHVGTGNPTAGSGVELVFPGGLVYTPGVKQTITVRVTESANVYGFQATARLVSNLANGQAGDFTVTDARVQILCEDGRPKTGSQACRPETPIQFAEHTLGGNRSNTWTFDWTPPATNMGDINFYVAGNAANGNGTESGDRIFTRNYTLTPQAATSEQPQIRQTQPVLQAFLGGARLSPGTWLEIYGSNFSAVTKDWGGLFTENGTKAPTSIDGVSVNIDGKPATMFFLSPSQINVQAPDTIGLGTVQVEVVTPAGRVSTTATSTAVSPAMLTTPAFNIGGKQYIAALHQGTPVTFVGPANLIQGANFRPAKPGDVVTVYAVGCGVTEPASPSGVVVSALRTPKAAPRVTIGQAQANVAVAMSPGSIGLCQLNVTIPNTANGDNPIEFTLDGTPTGQGLQITVQQ
ncbi:MAG: IPT/TIG domain-containing protein [Acidobacteria bacterium]|nr:IPT/TIG domain-containing protein [Acidobacteriota bacterium]